MFVLVIGGTEICKIPGISMAGANPQVVPFTAPADADLLLWGRPRIIDAIPVDPQGHPTPGIITRAAYLEAGFPALVVRAGSFLPPVTPYVEMGVEPGGDPSHAVAIPEHERLFEAGQALGASLGAVHDTVVIGESVPGGTTSAWCVLNALGYRGMVSSAGPENPVNLKQDLWNRVKARLGIEEGGLKGQGLRAAAEAGDPMQICVAGMVAGIPKGKKVVLAGGTQMLAVAAVCREMGEARPLLVATTKYVARDGSADFLHLAEQIGVETWVAPLDFSGSAFAGLRDYELGYVKEGVGAGGAVWYAEEKGIPTEQVARRVEALYDEMMRSGAGKGAH